MIRAISTMIIMKRSIVGTSPVIRTVSFLTALSHKVILFLSVVKHIHRQRKREREGGKKRGREGERERERERQTERRAQLTRDRPLL